MSEIKIEIKEGKRFREQIKDDINNPLTVMDVYVDGSHIKGGHTYVTLTLVEMLEAVEGILNEEKRVIEYSGGPSYLVFEPQVDDTMLMTGCGSIEATENPDKRLSIDTTVEANKHSWVAELVHTAEEYYNRIIELNPDLEGSESLQRLQDRITDVKQQPYM